MPGDDMHKIQKGITLDVDCICMDIEDGVAPNCKDKARATIFKALTSIDFGRSERLTRINPIGSGLEQDDLEIVLPARPDAIVVPKVENAEQIHWVSDQIGEVEDEFDWPENSIYLIAIVETARAVVNLPRIAAADARLEALVFGSEDFALDIGATRSRDAIEVFYARSAVVTHAAAFGLQAIDMVFSDLNDLDGLRHEAQRGQAMGFAGKQVIHPRQVAPVQEAFTPSDEAIADALRIVNAYQQHADAGEGAFVIDGVMVDAPVVRAAEQVLAIARTTGKI